MVERPDTHSPTQLSPAPAPARGGGWSRRQWLRGVGLGAVGMVALPASLSLAACGTEGGGVLPWGEPPRVNEDLLALVAGCLRAAAANEAAGNAQAATVLRESAARLEAEMDRQCGKSPADNPECVSLGGASEAELAARTDVPDSALGVQAQITGLVQRPDAEFHLASQRAALGLDDAELRAQCAAEVQLLTEIYASLSPLTQAPPVGAAVERTQAGLRPEAVSAEMRGALESLLGLLYPAIYLSGVALANPGGAGDAGRETIAESATALRALRDQALAAVQAGGGNAPTPEAGYQPPAASSPVAAYAAAVEPVAAGLVSITALTAAPELRGGWLTWTGVLHRMLAQLNALAAGS